MDREASDRTRRLLGDSAIEALGRSRVLVCGLGGVGSWCVEALARAGIGTLGLLDCDSFAPSNINRQLGALVSTLGQRKTDCARRRVLDINPDATVECFDFRYGKDTAERIDIGRWDAIADAIDQVSAKVLLAVRCRDAGVPLFSAMGGGNKFEPARFKTGDLFETNRCPLAKAMRKKLRRAGVGKLAVVASDEEPRRPFGFDPAKRVQTAGTLPTVTGTEGLLLAHAILAHIVGEPAAPLACTED